MVGCEEIKGDPQEWFDRIHADDRGRVESDIQAHLEGKTVCLESEYRIVHRDGTYRWVLTRGLAVRDQNGKATRMAGSQTDITERKSSEEEREQLLQKALEADRRKDESCQLCPRTSYSADRHSWMGAGDSFGKINEAHSNADWA